MSSQPTFEQTTGPSHEQLLEYVNKALTVIRSAGCAGSAGAARDDGWSVMVRGGKRETVRSTTSQGLWVHAVTAEGGQGSVTTNNPQDLLTAAAQAVAMARLGGADPHNGPPPGERCGLAPVDGLADPAWEHVDIAQGAALATACEVAARELDPRIIACDGATAQARRRWRVLVNTNAAPVSWWDHSGGCGIQVVAQDPVSGERQSGHARHAVRTRARLRSAQDLGQEASQRALSGFGWQQIPSGPMPVVFDVDPAEDFLGILASALSGSLVYRKHSYLHGRRGTRITCPGFSVVDNPLESAGPGSRPCDGEGVRSANLTVIDNGILEHYLVDSYASRRLEHPLTGHAGGSSNFLVSAPSTHSQADLFAMAGEGLFVQSFNGWGVDLVNGTFSRGVRGQRISGGVLTHAVQKVTISGQLDVLWQNLRAWANDADPDSAVRCPSLLLDGLTVGGS